MSKALEAGATIRSVLVQTTGLKEKKAAASMQIQEVFDIIKDDISAMEQGFSVNLNSNVYLVSKVGEYILKSGGKRFRPMVLLLSSRLCGYKGSNHIPLAGVVEFIHTATLLHDDVVDNANLRRGNATANTVWGDGASILVGDYLLSKSFSMAVTHGDMRILRVLSNTTTRMAEGEVLQLLKHSDADTTEKEYLDVVTNKTAVLISAAARTAAILGGVSTDKEGVMSLDTAKLKAALNSDFDGVVSLFTKGTATTGLAELIHQNASSIDDFVDGRIKGRQDGLKKNMTRIDQDIRQKETQLVTYEEQLRSQFTMLEGMLATLKGQGNALNNYFGGMY